MNQITPATASQKDQDVARAFLTKDLFLAHFHEGVWDGVAVSKMADLLTAAREEERVALKGPMADLETALRDIAEYGRKHPGFGFDCATKAIDALQRMAAQT